MDRIKHQLLIHTDYSPPPGGLEIRYSYPFSGPHELKEQTIRIPQHEIPSNVQEDLDAIVDALSTRIPSPTPSRLPHADINPEHIIVRKAIATVVIQDQHRTLPITRLYYYEEINEIKSSVEKEVQMRPEDFSNGERAVWERLRAAIKSIAWKNYKHLMRKHPGWKKD